ncbi:hypothetical protein [Legionella sp. km772]|nr:hypothetical protein [Legionella sp. km772]
MTSNKEQLKFRKLKAFSFLEMQALANQLDRKLIHKKKLTPTSMKGLAN